MPNEAAEQNGSLLHSIIKIIDFSTNDGNSLDALIQVLSLICLFSILNRNHTLPAPAALSKDPVNPLQKMLSDLTKGDSGFGPDTLMTLLPLLNSPQLKSKINPATISAVLGLMNNLGEKNDKPSKNEKPDPNETSNEPAESKQNAPPAAALSTLNEMPQTAEINQQPLTDKKSLGKYLNWKSNF